MDEIKTGHFGDILYRTSSSPGTSDIPFTVLRKAPLKYYDPARDKEDKEDKSKADVIHAYIADEWRMIGWTEHDPEGIDEDAIEELICTCLNSL